MSDVDWLATRNEIIYHALSNIGAIALGEDPSPEHQSLALFHLNSITKFLETKNLFLWNYGTETITTVVGQASNTFTNNDAIGIDGAYRKSGNVEIPLTIIPRATYDAISDKTTQGDLDQVFFDRSVSTPKIYFFPVPKAIQSVYVRTARRLKDWDTAAGNAMPAWWVEPLVWKLAASLSHPLRLSLPERDRLELKANGLMAEAFADNFKQNDLGEVNFYAD